MLPSPIGRTGAACDARPVTRAPDASALADRRVATDSTVKPATAAAVTPSAPPSSALLLIAIAAAPIAAT
ncbi:hypothetical protein GCM10022255_071230 [Dactylosporangium darangshiense]|uniref:Uncharacterized protein n=1 Tax=Dactylosporangium darangshiense TaxID=579108 RepID=A0ABP8DIG1_9ACTN